MTQLIWPHLLSVALRVEVSEALLSSGRGLEEFMEDAAARAVLKEFKLAAAAQVAACGREYRDLREAKKEGPAVDAYYRRVGEALRSARPRSPLARELFSLIQDVCSIPMCVQCDSTPCRWMRSSAAEDLSRVARSGACLRRVTDLFRWTNQVVASAYASACQGCSIRAPILTTGHSQRNSELDLAITALTYEETTPSEADRRRVHLSIDPDTVWVPDYLSLAYVFMHECVAHAWCGVNVEDEGAARSKPFHDGWMDSIAALVLEKNLFPESGASHSLASEMSAQTDRIRSLRFNASREASSADVHAWIRGAKALEALWWLFCQAQSGCSADEDWDRASLESREPLLVLSLRINASAMSHALRSRFVLAIATNYSRTGTAARTKALLDRPQIIDLIEDYLQMGDHEHFVRKVLEICRPSAIQLTNE